MISESKYSCVCAGQAFRYGASRKVQISTNLVGSLCLTSHPQESTCDNRVNMISLSYLRSEKANDLCNIKVLISTKHVSCDLQMQYANTQLKTALPN